MQPVQVDVVGVQPLQAGLAGLHHVLALVAAGVGVVARGFELVYLVARTTCIAVPCKKFAEERLARAVGVEVGGIDEVAARLAEGVYISRETSLLAPQPQSSPKVIVPRQSSETRRPLCPNSRYLMTALLIACAGSPWQKSWHGLPARVFMGQKPMLRCGRTLSPRAAIRQTIVVSILAESVRGQDLLTAVPGGAAKRPDSLSPAAHVPRPPGGHL